MNTRHDKDEKKDARKEDHTEHRPDAAKEAADAKAAEAEAAAATQAASVAQATEAVQRSKPFPSQEEQDRFARGERGFELEPDGSPPSPHGLPVDHRLGRKTPEEEELEKQGFKKVDRPRVAEKKKDE